MHKPSIAPLGVLALALSACPGDDNGTSETTGEDSTSTTTTSSTPPSTTTIDPMTTTGMETETGTTDDPTTTGLDTGTSTTADTDTDSDTDTTTDTDSTTSGGMTTTGVMCMPPEEDCDGMCVDTTMSAEHCGMCGNPCMMGDMCAMSQCNGVRELLSNGDFGAGTTDWTAENNPDQVLTCMGIMDDEMLVFSDGGGFITNQPGSMGPSSHVFYQDFVVPAGVTAASFSIDYALDLLGGVLDPANVQTIVKDCLDENMDGLEQNAFRIDIIDPAANVFLAPILFELGTPDMSAGDPILPTLVNLSNVDPALLAFLQGEEGNTLRLRIAQVESTFPFFVAFDDVSMVVNVTY